MSKNAELSDPISLRLPVDVLTAIEQVAKATDRTRSWVIVRALRRYLQTEGAQILDVVEGRAQIAAGDAHDMDDVLDDELRRQDVRRLRHLWDQGIASGTAGELEMTKLRGDARKRLKGAKKSSR